MTRLLAKSRGCFLKTERAFFGLAAPYSKTAKPKPKRRRWAQTQILWMSSMAFAWEPREVSEVLS